MGTKMQASHEVEQWCQPRLWLRGHPVASDPTEALRADRGVTLDERALNIFLRTDFYFGGDTPFRELRRVEQEPVIVPPIEISRDEALDAYIALFRQAVRRRMTNDTVLALSGGQDSRHILLELHAGGNVPDLLTVDLTAPHMVPANMPVWRVVCFASGADVRERAG